MATGRLPIHRFMSIIIVCLLLVSLTSVTMAFSDTQGHWAESAIGRWSDEYGILLGSDGKFRPDAPITRGEMAAILDRLLAYTQDAGGAFADIEGEEWYAKSMLRLYAAGVMLGDGTYMYPQAHITREQAAAMLVRAFGFEAFDDMLAVEAYADYDAIATWAVAQVNTLTCLGYVQGNENCFNPKGELTRGEAVTILNNIIGGMVRDGGTFSDDVRGNVLVNAEDPVILKEMYITGNLYIAHCVTVPLTLENVVVGGNIINLSGVDPIRLQTGEEDPGAGDSEEKLPFDALSLEYITYGQHQILIADNIPLNPYDDALFYRGADERMYYNSDEHDVLTGIDISAWQQDVDWSRVAEQGIDFVMLRVGFRGYTAGTINLDAYFHQNIQGALQAGLKVGVYFFSQAITPQEAREEAAFVLDAISGYDISFPVVYDWECVYGAAARTDGLSTESLCAAANAFCQEVENAGYIPMVYLNLDIGYLYYDLSEIAAYDFWLAQYAETPGFYYDFSIWQYTASGRVDGVPGPVDMNIAFVDYAKR